MERETFNFLVLTRVTSESVMLVLEKTSLASSVPQFGNNELVAGVGSDASVDLKQRQNYI